MSASAYFHSRAGSLLAGPAVKLKPLRFSKSAVGGPKRAEIRADGGSLVDLYDLLAYLGQGMRIQLDGQDAWWGFLDELHIYEGLTETVVSLERMYNRVATAYELTTAGSERSTRATSAWFEDTMSGAQYGWKELLATSRANSSGHAATDAARLLELHKAPPALLMAAGGRTEKPYATLVCSGWWKTLGWRYASVPLLLALQYPTIGLEDLAIGNVVVATSYTTTAGSADQALGDAAPRRYLLQQFTLEADCWLIDIQIYGRKSGSPTDNLTAALYALDGSGNPTGSPLASKSLAGADISGSNGWITFTFSSAEQFAAGQYGLRLERSGAEDASNYYVWVVNAALGYAGGAFKIFNDDTDTWAARGTNADGLFSVDATTAVRVAQVFDVGPASIDAAAVEVYVRKVGSPVDNLVVSILANPDDATPGASLVSANVSGALLGTDYAWTRVTFSSVENLAADGTFFLQISRSGGLDAVNYYELRMDTLEGYAGGPCLTFEGAWSSHEADMPFRIFTDEIVETSQQILSLLTSYGQFMARPVVEQASGVDLESYRDGDSTALAEIEHLMEIGTSSGRRYLAEVNESLHLRVFEEPVETDGPYTIDRELRVFDGSGAPVEGWRAPVGVYMRSRSSAIGVLNRLAGINLTMFVEEMEYDVESRGLRMTPRGAPKAEDELLRVANG